jgi:hypothetical protein
MNASRILGVLTVTAAVAITVGCSKQEQPVAATTPAATTAEAPAPTVDKTIQAAPAIVPVPAADAAPATAPAPAAATAPATTTDVAPADSSQTQGLIDKAKSLVDGGQYTDASKILQQLSSIQLTPDQQKMVDDLKTVIQTKLGAAGASSLGGLLGK